MKNQNIQNHFSIKKATIAAALVLSQYAAWAQDAAPKASEKAGELNNILMWVFLIIIAVLLLGTSYIVSNTMRLYRDLLTESYAKEHGITLPLPSVSEAKESIFSKIWYQLTGTGAVAIEKEKDIMIEHPHDGIYELDNQLPPWWINMFYITIVFAVFYIGYYHFYHNGERGQIYEYKAAVKVGEIQKAAAAEKQANAVNENNVVALTDAKILDGAKSIFIEKCAACHGQKGEGGVGPNLTDEFWLHGGSVKNIFGTIKNGVPAKGMIAWKDQVRAADIQALASYILTLNGTNPPNPKAPQGEKYVPEAAAPAATDTTKIPAPAKTEAAKSK